MAVEGIEEVKKLIGQEIGVGDWHEVTQDQINKFADATPAEMFSSRSSKVPTAHSGLMPVSSWTWRLSTPGP